MKQIIISVLMLSSLWLSKSSGQINEQIKKDMPPYLSVLLEWGQRPEWSRDGKYIYFRSRDYSDVFRIDVKTKKIEPVTAHYFQESYTRVLCLHNGDLLLEGPEKYDSSNPWEPRHKLSLCVLKAPFDKPAIPLNRNIDEDPAISRVDDRSACTLSTQRKINMAELEYDEQGNPVLKNERIVLNFDRLGIPMSQRLETQDFFSNSNKLDFTFYRGTLEESFCFADPDLLDLETGKYEPIIDHPTGYNEAEGISPDGKFLMIESDHDHEPKHWNLDIYMLMLDGSVKAIHLLDWSDRFSGCHSDNPVVSPDGKTIAFQFGFNNSQPGQGKGIFLLDVEQYKKMKKNNYS